MRWGLAPAALLAAGCSGQMSDQPRFEPFERSAFFADGRSARPPVAGAVARGALREDELFEHGGERGRAAERFPFPVTPALLARGRERYEAFCVPCHGLAGYGDGPVVRRGFPAPPSFHSEGLRRAPPGRLVQAQAAGFGLMDSYANRVGPADRWAIAAYLRALQLSQDARPADAPPARRRRLESVR